ncbi:MAG: ATP-binding protein [Butyrivibrio sp.]|nr:ATP-binding protein [Butyrivibrio sp.]
MKEKVLRATTENIEELLEFVAANLEPYSFETKTRKQIYMAVEEIFVNISEYAYQDEEGEIVFQMDTADDPLTVMFRFTDEGIPFNPLQKEDPDIHKPLREKKPGGLGIFIVKNTMDRTQYDYCDGKNILTFWKKL